MNRYSLFESLTDSGIDVSGNQTVRAGKAAVHWLCVCAIIAEFNMGGYQYALSRYALSTR